MRTETALASASTDRRSRRTREAIRAAFQSLAYEMDIEKITVSALAERADINRKTFYCYYASIDALIQELLEEEAAKIVDMASHIKVEADGSYDVAELFQVISTALVAGMEEGRLGLLAHADAMRYLKRVERVLERALIENDSLGLAEALGPYLEYGVAFFCSGLMAAYRQWYHDDSELPMEELSDMLGASVAGGIAALTQGFKPAA